MFFFSSIFSIDKTELDENKIIFAVSIIEYLTLFFVIAHDREI